MPRELISRADFIDVKTPVPKALSMLNGQAALVVNRNGAYYGVIDSRSVYRAKGQLSFKRNQGIEGYVARIPPVDRATPVDDVMMAFYRTRAKAIPFMEKGRVIGILDKGTMLKIMLSLRMLNGMSVSDAMSSPAIAVSDEVAMSQARSIMESNKISRLLVMHNGRFAGLLTYFTLIKNYSVESTGLPEMKTRKYSPTDISISGIMERNPKVARDDKDLPYAARRMVENDISSLVIVNSRDSPVGMLTVSDMLERVMARRRIEDNRIFISGFDESDMEYEPEVKAGLRSLVERVEGKDMKVEYVFAHFKKTKGKRYDVHIRVSTASRGTISAHITDFLLERTFRKAAALLKRDILKEKGRVLKMRKSDQRLKLIE